MKTLTPVELVSRVDVALWKPAATVADIEAFCADVREHKFRAVCVNGSQVALTYARLEESGVQVVALVGSPFGATEADVKRYEVEVAIDHGAQEIEVVPNPGWLKDGAHKLVLRELRDVVEAADERPVCAVVETTQLTRDEITAACHLIQESGAKAVSTGTDFWPEARASEADVKVLRENLGPKFVVKAAGGIHEAKTALALLDAGANRVSVTDPSCFWQSLRSQAR
jgi:deoxyribose-phosphate aldolase